MKKYHHNPRSTSAKREFKWSDIDVWEPKIRELVADVLDERVFTKFHEDPLEFVVGDDLSWLDQIIRSVHGQWPDRVHDVLTRRIAAHYASVIGFHACRPISLGDYKRDGLRVCDPEELNRIAREIFGDASDVAAAIEDLAKGSAVSGYSYTKHNSGSIYFALSPEELVQSCGQYLLYGSEYLLCIGARLRREEELRKRGRATVIECRVPIEAIPKNYLRCLAGEVIEEIFERELDPEFRRLAINFGFPIRENIAPRHVVAFHHPRDIPNHRKGMVLEN
jgi:hypothetical protein